jgi:hypothetical protein
MKSVCVESPAPVAVGEIVGVEILKCRRHGRNVDASGLTRRGAVRIVGACRPSTTQRRDSIIARLAPTNPDFVSKRQHGIDAELARSIRLVEELGLRSLEGTWPENNAFGRMNGTEWSRLMAKHLDHDLPQFVA